MLTSKKFFSALAFTCMTALYTNHAVGMEKAAQWISKTCEEQMKAVEAKVQQQISDLQRERNEYIGRLHDVLNDHPLPAELIQAL